MTHTATQYGVTVTPEVIDKAPRAWNVTPGELLYFPNQTGPWKNTVTAARDYLDIKARVDAYNTLSKEYNIALKRYNALATIYNALVTKEKARRTDPL